MGPLSSLRIPRVRRYSGSNRLSLSFVYGALTLFDRTSHSVRLLSDLTSVVLNPFFISKEGLASSDFARHYSRNLVLDFFSSPYLDVSVREVPFLTLCIQARIYDSSSYGFPHSDIRGSMLISNSPRLFAGYHVLLRLSVPRHSPYALFRLNSLPVSLFFPKNILRFFCLSFANNCFWVVIEKTILVFFHVFVRLEDEPSSKLTKLFFYPLIHTEKPFIIFVS